MEIIDKDQMIGEVAEKYGLLLSEDDPIFSLVVLNKEIIAYYHLETKKRLKEQLEKLEYISQSQIVQSRNISEEIIGSSVNLVSQEIEQGLDDIEKRLRKWVVAVHFKKEARTIKLCATLIAGLTIINTFILLSSLLF